MSDETEWAEGTGGEPEEEIRRLREALEAKAREAEGHQDRALRAMAELDNAKKRAAREREDYTRYANESLLREILPVLDNFERALQAAKGEPAAAAVTAGVELIQRELFRVLEKFGVTVLRFGGAALRSDAPRGRGPRQRARTTGDDGRRGDRARLHAERARPAPGDGHRRDGGPRVHRPGERGRGLTLPAPVTFRPRLCRVF